FWRHHLRRGVERRGGLDLCRRSGGRTIGSTLAGVIWTRERFPTWTKLNSRAASKALTASFTRERGTKFPKKLSISCWSAAITQSRYVEISADRASPTDKL